MSLRLQGKTALLTAAGQGIGLATALAFAGEGARVWATDINEGALASLAMESPNIVTRCLDVTDAESISKTMAEAGAFSILFNCAGYVHNGTILDCSEADWDTSFDINVRSMYRIIRAALPAMIDNGGGSIVNVASVASNVKGVPNRFLYGATKAAVVGLTKAVAADFVGQGIRCNAICPGTVQTPSLDARINAFDDPKAARAAFTARQPMGRLGTAEEIAALAVYLASDESTYTTGTEAIIDGGMTI